MVFYGLIAAIFVVAIICFIVTAREWKNRYQRWERAWSSGLVGMFFAAVIAAFLGVFILTPLAAYAANGTEHTVKNSYSLAALNLKTEQQTSGSVGGALTFLWGSISSDGVRKIDYIQDVTGDGGFAPKSLAADEAIIHEVGGSPHLVISHKVRVDKTHIWVPWDTTYSKPNYTHDFYVPKGSIIQQYSVDNTK